MKKFPKRLGCCGIALLVLVLIVGLIVGLLTYSYNSVLDEIQRVEGTEPTLSVSEIESIENETDPPEEIPEDFTELEEDLDIQLPEEEEEAVTIPASDDIINILLIGQDRREGEGRTRSDTMILCTINTQKKTMVMTSFLRDLYVDIPNWNGRTYLDNRLNACYAFGGMGMLDAALKNNFGVQVDHNIEVDFDGFMDIVHVFGGVDIELTAAEAKYMGGGLKAGMNHLTPEQALTYARIRKLDSDFGRTNRQRKVLTSMLGSVSTLSADQLTALANRIFPVLTTDMSNSDITSCMMRLLPILPELQISTQTIPASGTYRSCKVRGMAVLVPDLQANRQILRDTLN